MSDSIEQFTLACGLPLLVQKMDTVRSCALNWLVPCGGSVDPTDRLGTAEVLGEMLMRGAGGLDSRQQTDAFDRLGASRSAEAGARFTRLGATMLGDKLDDTLPLIADMIRSPMLSGDSLEPARLLAMQQLASLADDPQERAVLGARAAHYPSPFDRTGMGTAAGLGAIDRDGLAAHWGQHAVPRGSILAIAGQVDPARVVSRLDVLLKGWEGEASVPAFEGSGPRGYHHLEDDSNQVQIVVVHDAPREADETSVLERVVLAVLSGGMSSRLFSEVREKRGLCYAVHAGYRGEKDFGTVTGYVGTTPERAQEALDVLVAELERINTSGVTPEEFERAITGLTSRVVFSGESTGARSAALANDFFKRGRARTLSEVREGIMAVTLDEVNAYLKARTLGRMTVQTLGPKPLTPPASIGG
ncbi:MAG: putative Zn-dependent peptidase [Phycisphaerales bacterium]